jgi:hypothetical protein
VLKSTVATSPSLLSQLPPAVVLVNVVVLPIHTELAPAIAAGNGLTVNEAVVLHTPIEYVIFTTPAPTPVTTPVVPPTVATSVLLLLHVPPLTEFVSVVDDPAHTNSAPEIASGVALIVTVAVRTQPVDIV